MMRGTRGDHRQKTMGDAGGRREREQRNLSLKGLVHHLSTGRATKVSVLQVVTTSRFASRLPRRLRELDRMTSRSLLPRWIR